MTQAQDPQQAALIAELDAAEDEYVATKERHNKARQRIEDAIVAALQGGVYPADVYDHVSEAISDRQARTLARNRGVEPTLPWEGRRRRTTT